MNTIKIFEWQQYSEEQKIRLLQRSFISNVDKISQVVNEILLKVKKEGDKALHEFNAHFDKSYVENLRISPEDIKNASSRVNNKLKQAISIAIMNIKVFHNAQKIEKVDIETQPGVRCEQVIRPIQAVGLYIPSGSASLFSTVLMLAIPAQLAGCNRIVICSPPPINDYILYAAQSCGVNEIYQVGGAQAIAAMAFGTEKIFKVNKIFGPGNVYVTEAKRQIIQHTDNVAIDMLAGPSEILLIADKYATPSFIASDILSQIEHGPDSQAIVLTPSMQLAKNISLNIKSQLISLPRAAIVRQALENSCIIITHDLTQCIDIANQYGPEHLIIQTRKPRQLIDHINNAGSVFLGDWSPESAGDYASGTNHVLPTYGCTATHSSIGLSDFQKRMTIQELMPHGLLNLAETIEILANAEQLEAHKNAVTLRVNALKEQQQA
ncbi:histidinol dehydrogenase [Pantoea sp. Aalb]|uniref:histidinol dehydrogenase n=1 Tax=Pantoea sp. Aalb TaxID=2576762 RepID=UPI001324C2C7|nr:histidinol dehydrogenase [Pantoea sp. Aalb]MXP67338.1 histidinol dehydrogenase [Pantoea sp. Aalb]